MNGRKLEVSAHHCQCLSNLKLYQQTLCLYQVRPITMNYTQTRSKQLLFWRENCICSYAALGLFWCWFSCHLCYFDYEGAWPCFLLSTSIFVISLFLMFFLPFTTPCLWLYPQIYPPGLLTTHDLSLSEGSYRTVVTFTHEMTGAAIRLSRYSVGGWPSLIFSTKSLPRRSMKFSLLSI